MTALLVKFLGFLLYANILLTGVLYVYLRNRRQFIRFQDGINIATMVGGFIAVICGVILIYQFPFHYVVVTIITTLIGIVVGACFGALFNLETLLTGYTHGMMMGLMSPMIGAAAKNSIAFLIFLELFFLTSLFIAFRFTGQRSETL
ncbi:hypothetical protein [Pueribacillus sp. YX66]|uniref:hypothetical protein n=1 Tax=Pueribacillus sp. YX66 TaxID=3229242 RepID=UPI0036D42B99